MEKQELVWVILRTAAVKSMAYLREDGTCSQCDGSSGGAELLQAL